MICGGLYCSGTQLTEPLISVITVVYNGQNEIRRTIESVISQKSTDIEYLIFDGFSKDGTLDIIREYEKSIHYWQSEPDDGMYFAMNKGISMARGKWINFLNCGDEFCDTNTLATFSQILKDSTDDVVYGDSIESSTELKKYIFCEEDVGNLVRHPIYRHGCSFVRNDVHKNNLFDTSLLSNLGYALDYECIYRLFIKGYSFKYYHAAIQIYELSGISNNPVATMSYVFKITHAKPLTFTNRFFLLLKQFGLSLYILLKKNIAFKYLITDIFNFLQYLYNYLFSYFPIQFLRHLYLRILGIHVEMSSHINMATYFMITPGQKTHIGRNTHINHGCFFDARGGIIIGNNVSISHNVSIITVSHETQSSNFLLKSARVRIDDYVWIGLNATILQGVIIGKGAVVAAGAMVTKDVQPFEIVAGIPARKIGDRNRDLNYKVNWHALFT